MSSRKTEIAIKGEQLAAEYLTNKGFSILERNWRYSRSGEIDIIVKRDNVIAFVEVKTRKTTNCGDPLESITRGKQRQIYNLARAYINYNSVTQGCIYRFDAVGIILSYPPQINHIENAFTYDS